MLITMITKYYQVLLFPASRDHRHPRLLGGREIRGREDSSTSVLRDSDPCPAASPPNLARWLGAIASRRTMPWPADMPNRHGVAHFDVPLGTFDEAGIQLVIASQGYQGCRRPHSRAKLQFCRSRPAESHAYT